MEEPAAVQTPRHRLWWFAGGLALAGLALRWWFIGRFHLNVDEAWHIDTASRDSLGDVIASVFEGEVHPPLNFLLLHAMLHFSSAAAALRLLFVVPWMIWAFACYHVGLRLGGRRHGLVWAALAVLTGGSLEYSLSIREYMWMLLFLTGQFYFFIRFHERPSLRPLLLYGACGMLALGFEYSVAIAIFVMGGFLAWRMLRDRLKPLSLTLAVAAVHLLMGAELLLLYTRHHFLRHDVDIQWYNSLYYGPTPAAFFGFLGQVATFLAPIDWVWLCMAELAFIVLLFVITVKPFLRRFPIVACLFYADVLLMLALNAFQVYPYPALMRHMTWMLPAVMAWLAFSADYLAQRMPERIRPLVAAAAMAAMVACVLAWFRIPYAQTPGEYNEFLEVARKAGPGDIIFMDSQTMMLLRYGRNDSGWKQVASFPHLDEMRWEGRTVFYPNWSKIDSIDIRTNETAGTMHLHRQSLIYFAQMLEQRQKQGAAIPSVWVMQLGYPSYLSKECYEAVGDRFGTVLLHQQKNYIARFRPQEFMDWVAYCPPLAQVFQLNY